MKEGPYRPAKAAGAPKAGQQGVDPQWRGFAVRHKRRAISLERPIGVTIACAVNVILPIAFLLLFMCVDSARLLVILGRGMTCPGIYLANIIVVSAALMGCCFGMWEGAKWSWWMMTFLQLYVLLDTTIGEAILSSVFPSQSAPFASRNVFLFARGVGNSALWILYFFTDDVLAFFQQPQERKLMRGAWIGLAAGIAIAVKTGFEIAL